MKWPCIGSVVCAEAVGGPPTAAGVRAERRHGRRRQGGRRAEKREPSGPRAVGAEDAGAETAACLGGRRRTVLGAAVAAQPRVAGGMAAWQAAARRAASGEAGGVGGVALPSRGRACAAVAARPRVHRGRHGGLAGGGEAGGERRGRRGRWRGASVAWPCVCGGGGARQQQTQTKTKTSLGETGSSRPNREQSRSGLVAPGPRERQ